ncbi:MAG: hypothetical protein II309_02060 [Bacilli bacterium]|nr:hypothetical protein [Bacilli bacterium]
MKIKEVTYEEIIFDNGNTISFSNEHECYEDNYADFSILDKNNVNYNYDFDEDLIFEATDGLGFRFGSNGRWIFIPCYSEQNGNYTDEIDIYYKNERVLRFDAKEILA